MDRMGTYAGEDLLGDSSLPAGCELLSFVDVSRIKLPKNKQLTVNHGNDGMLQATGYSNSTAAIKN